MDRTRTEGTIHENLKRQRHLIALLRTVVFAAMSPTHYEMNAGELEAAEFALDELAALVVEVDDAVRQIEVSNAGGLQ